MSHLVNAFRTASTVGDFGRARIDLQRFGTPAEVLQVASMSDALPMESAVWVRQLAEYCTVERHDVASFTRATEDSSWTLFEGKGARSDRELVVGFTGRAGNLYQPSPVVLQYLDPTRHDLLLLRDAAGTKYLSGCGPASSFDGLMDSLAGLAHGYSSSVTLGSSAGGAPALFAGLRLGARRAVSLGGNLTDPSIVHEYTGTAEPGGELAHPYLTEFWAVFGEGCAPDRTGAAALATVFPSLRRMAIAGIESHSLLHACFQRGTSGALYDMLLGEARRPSEADSPADGAAGTVVNGPVEILILTPRFVVPPWADPVRTSEAWLSNTAWIPDGLRRWIVRRRLPDRVASRLERFAYNRFGIAVHLSRTRKSARR